MARISVSCTVVVALSMLYEIPLPASVAYVVFLLTREDSTSTALTGVVGAITATFAVALALFIYVLDAGEPALRLPIMALATFAGMFCSRTMTLGPAAFLGAYVLVYSQTLIDRIRGLEALTHLVLWLWVISLVPATVTVIINLAFGDRPAPLARDTAGQLLRGLAAALRNTGGSRLHELQKKAVRVLEMRRRADLGSRDFRHLTESDGALVETMAELLLVCGRLPPDASPAWRAALADTLDACERAFAEDAAPIVAELAAEVPPLASLPPEERAVFTALEKGIARLAEGLAQRAATPEPGKALRAPAPARRSLFVADAFTSPRHIQFALKSSLAVMTVFIVFNGLGWQEISTAVTTCFFVALGSLGESMHKLTLRIGGALLGGVVAGLCIVFVMPSMTDIGHLCLLVAIASAAFGWIATSDERLSYAGLQSAFAFFLCILQGHGPVLQLLGRPNELTILRDRLVGILLGNLVVAIVFSTVWPTSAAGEARHAVAGALRGLAAAVTRKTSGAAAVVKGLVDARRLHALAAFELRMVHADGASRTREARIDDGLERLAGAVLVVAEQEADPAYDEALARWLDSCADVAIEADGPISLPAFLPTIAMPSDDELAFAARTALAQQIEETRVLAS